MTPEDRNFVDETELAWSRSKSRHGEVVRRLVSLINTLDPEARCREPAFANHSVLCSLPRGHGGLHVNWPLTWGDLGVVAACPPVAPTPERRPTRALPAGWLSAEQVALLVGYSSRWVRRHMGHLAHRLNRRDFRWQEDVVKAWLAEHAPLPSPLEILP